MNPHKKSTSIILVLLVALLLVMAMPNGYVLAAKNDQTLNSLGKGDGHKCCVPVKVIRKVRSERILRRNGFYIDLYGTGSLDFDREGKYKFGTLSVRPDVDPDDPYTAARITEVDTSLPADQRIKCWQPTDRFDVVIKYTIRLGQLDFPGLTENMLMWNAPFDGENSLTFTAVGVTRNILSEGNYVAMFAQDLDLGTGGGILLFAPMPDWLDYTSCHHVRLTISKFDVKIEVAQGEHDYEIVLESNLENPIEPLALEFSLDNEILPGVINPTFGPDTLDVASLSMRYKIHK